MLIILFCFSMLTAITITAVQNYADDAKLDSVAHSASAAADYLNRKANEMAKGSDPDLFFSEEQEEITEVLRAVAAYSDDITLIVTDLDGRVVVAVNKEKGTIENAVGLSIPSNVMEDFKADKLEKTDGLTVVSGELWTSATYVYVDGNPEGIVFSCAKTETLNGLNDVMIRTISISSLWVLIAAFIAVYFITDKIIDPLKDMSRAAKSFADGDFSVRVPVRGRDEVAELATAFNNMAKSLEASDKMRNTFMANVSHDLRTPMTTIAGFIDGILDGVIPKEKHEYYLNIIATEVRRLSRLVSQLLDISRIEAGDRKFNMQPFDICEMGRQILISFEQKIEEKRLDVEFETDNDNMTVLGDRDAIYQIMYNICDNAVKFSKEKGKLLIGINRLADEKITVTVYNEGQGIPADDLPYVFERFYKGDKSRGLDKSGVGLGMYISKTIIEAHNEKISVDSVYGEYCRFSFTLTDAKDKNL